MDNMTVVYADIMILTSTAMLFASYLTAALIHNIGIRVVRILVISFILSVISTIVILYLGFMANPVTAVLLLSAGTALCFGKMTLKKNITYSLTALASAILAGGVRLATGSFPWVIPVTLMYIGIFIFIKQIRSAAIQHQRLCPIILYRGDTKVSLTALIDTGNELSYRGERVIIAEKKAVAPLYENPGEDLRLIPYKSIGNNTGVLIGIKCDGAWIDNTKKDTVIVAAVDTSLGRGVYNALIDPETEVI